MKRGFTLIEIIVVIIIVGLLAAIGISQYSATVEKSRLAEAKVRIGNMRQLAYEYYLNNGTLTGLTNDDLGADGTCTTSGFYSYGVAQLQPTYLRLVAARCTSGGKPPDAARYYTLGMLYAPATGSSSWYCYYQDDGSACFGLPNWI